MRCGYCHGGLLTQVCNTLSVTLERVAGVVCVCAVVKCHNLIYEIPAGKLNNLLNCFAVVESEFLLPLSVV